MARRIDPIVQSDFSLGQVRPEILERDDTEVLARSVKRARNCISIVPGPIEARPGTLRVSGATADTIYPVDLGGGDRFNLKLAPNSATLENEDGTTHVTFTGTVWNGSEDFWVVVDSDSQSILIGAQEFAIRAIVKQRDGTFAFGTFSFNALPGGGQARPFWNFEPGVTIQPSARTGSVTVTASDDIFTSDHVGSRLRYNGRQMLITAFTNATTVTATVTQKLPPTITLTVDSTDGFLVDQAVEELTNGGQGIVTDISGSDVTLIATAYWDGFKVGGILVGPQARATISAKSTVSPAATLLWDEQLMSAARGYAGTADIHKRRLVLGGFPQAVNTVAVSSAGIINDFSISADDGAGLVDTVGAGGELRHVVSGEDLLFLTSAGVYYQQTRDGSPLTPSTFSPVRFDRAGSSPIRPAVVDDGVVFVDAGGEAILACILQGDIYKSWRVIALTDLHEPLINAPICLSAPPIEHRAERFVYIVNADGTAAGMRWDREGANVGWFPWDTVGSFKRIFPSFGATWVVAERTIAATTALHLERLDDTAMVDCAVVLTEQAGATLYTGHTADMWGNGWDLGSWLIDANGYPVDSNGDIVPSPAGAQAGFAFPVEIEPWSRRSVQSFSGATRAVKREVMFFVTVQDTAEFRHNGERWGGYIATDDFEVTPAYRTEEVRFLNLGKGAYPTRVIDRLRPGPLRITRLRWRVSV